MRALRKAGACLWVLLLDLAMAPAWARSQRASGRPADLTEMSLEELANIEVTSVSKKQQKLSQVAAAVYVITQEDIRRSGATTIAEALRMAPGLDVARIDSSTWAVSARGFNGQYSNKMLVLVDGRSVYSPLFSGVYWDEQDPLLDDVDRIEVIRGPGATMWGDNAVNGVINIITKDARDTQGGLFTAVGGNEEQGSGGMRYGGRLGSTAYYRAYTKYSHRNHLTDLSGEPAGDAWYAVHSGFRLDWDVSGKSGKSGKDALTVEGDLYGGRNGQPLTVFSLQPPFSRPVDGRIDSSGGDALLRWRRRFSEDSDMALQVYYDRTDRQDAVLGELRNTLDVDFQHRFMLRGRQEVLWGLEHRYTTDDTSATAVGSLDPGRRGTHLYSAFLQDEISLVPEKFRFAVGTKFEHNDYTGFEVQPSLRLLWTPRPRQGVWFSVARAVRTPSRGEQDGRLNLAAFAGPGGIPVLAAYVGNPNLGSEDLLAYELGYRLQVNPRLSFDLAGFYDVYTNLAAIATGTPLLVVTPPPHLVLPLSQENLKHGHTHGIEVSARWNPLEHWKLDFGYTGYAGLPPPSTPNAGITGASDPGQQFQVRSYLDLTRTVQFDTAVYRVGELAVSQIPSYTRVDARLGWRPIRELDLSLVLQNALDDKHPEFVSEVLLRKTQVGRSAYLKITWGF